MPWRRETCGANYGSGGSGGSSGGGGSAGGGVSAGGSGTVGTATVGTSTGGVGTGGTAGWERGNVVAVAVTVWTASLAVCCTVATS